MCFPNACCLAKAITILGILTAVGRTTTFAGVLVALQLCSFRSAPCTAGRQMLSRAGPAPAARPRIGLEVLSSCLLTACLFVTCANTNAAEVILAVSASRHKCCRCERTSRMGQTALIPGLPGLAILNLEISVHHGDDHTILGSF